MRRSLCRHDGARFLHDHGQQIGEKLEVMRARKLLQALREGADIVCDIAARGGRRGLTQLLSRRGGPGI